MLGRFAQLTVRRRSLRLATQIVSYSLPRTQILLFRTVEPSSHISQSLNQTSFRIFSSTATHGTRDLSSSPSPTEIRSVPPWMDTRKSLQRRVECLLEAEQIQPYHFTILENLMRDCCRKQQRSSLVGLQMAHDILDRLYVEKRRLLEEQKIVVTVPSRLIQMVVFGWGVISDQRNVAFFRMKELMQLAVEQAIIDRRVYEKASANPESYTLGSGQLLDPPLSQPDADLYNTYLVGLVQASKSHPKAAIMAEGVLHEMNRYHQELGWHTRPNTKSYGHLITAWGNTNAPEAGERALAILRALQQTHNEQALAYESDHGIPYDEKNSANNKRKIATADIISYTSTLKALAARQPDRAMELLREIMQSETVTPDLRTFITAMSAFKGSASKQSDPRKRLRAAQRAEQVLWYMIDFVRAKRCDDIEKHISDDDKALVLGFNVCLDIWSKTRTREAAPRCEEILQKMLEEKIYPDAASFNACLNAWSQSASFHKDATERASQMLSFQHELAGGFLGESVQPDFQSYAIVIRAYSDSEKADRIVEARDILDSLLSRFKHGDINSSRNPASPFTSVITVAANYSSSDVRPANKVKDAFMDSIDTSNDAYSIAQRTFLELRDDVHGLGASPDHHTYAAYLKCLAKHTIPGSSERELKVRMVFEEACKAGAVSRLVIEAMKDANLGRSLALAIPELQSNNFPKFWMINVPGEFQHRAPRRNK